MVQEGAKLPNNGPPHLIRETNTVPVPDPTLLTTQQLLGAVQALRELLETKISAADKRIDNNVDIISRLELRVIEEVGHLRELHNEKFRGITVQFTERDIRVEETSRSSKIAVDAALQAAKEAVGEQNKSNALAIAKSENATTKQLDQLSQVMTTVQKSMDDKISDVKERMIEGVGRSTGHNDAWGYFVGAVGVLLAIAAIILRAHV